MDRPKRQRKAVSFRRIRDISLPAFQEDIADVLVRPSCSISSEALSPDEMIAEFNSSCINVIDKHAPLINKTITIRPDAAWYTPELLELKRAKRAAERRSIDTDLTVDRIIFDDLCDTYNHQLDCAKSAYYSDKIQSSSDKRSMFSLTSKLAGTRVERQLPAHSSKSELSEQFSIYFEEKIAKIQSVLLTAQENTQPFDTDIQDFIEPPFIGEPLDCFRPATLDEIVSLINKSKSKTCSLDPLPTSMLKQCPVEFAPSILQVINSAIEHCTVPAYFKHALINPIIKKPSLDPNDFKNYRPVSNLPYTSKLLEKVIAARLDEHLIRHQLEDPMQSAYKKHHSTESALLRVHNDITSALDSGSGVVLLMLDLSAAFDTINHRMLFHRLQHHYGITGEALQLIISYFHDRTQAVTIDGVTSSKRELKIGVPQGSGLGPKKYCMYSKPVGRIIRLHGMLYHIYADDGQIYIVISPDFNQNEIVSSLENCVGDILRWMTLNHLKLNEDKTELIYFQSRYLRPPMAFPPLSLGSCTVHPVDSVKNLGCYLDSKVTMDTQVNSVIRSCCYQISLISKIRRYLDTDSCKALVNATVTSRLDYCNALLLGCTDGQILRLQRVQNKAARMVTLRPKLSNIAAMLRDLHWLPVQARIDFKVLTFTYKATHNEAPVYLEELINTYTPGRSLRARNNVQLVQPRYHRKTFAAQNFSIMAPHYWNQLTASIQGAASLDVFKKVLKTFMFKRSIGGDSILPVFSALGSD